ASGFRPASANCPRWRWSCNSIPAETFVAPAPPARARAGAGHRGRRAGGRGRGIGA
nr:hypothetical protein [Tanacetum cinerariifolium]